MPTATESYASHCAARCSATRSRIATPASASYATRFRPPSWPRPRSSCRRCCRCSPADDGKRRPAGECAFRASVTASGDLRECAFRASVTASGDLRATIQRYAGVRLTMPDLRLIEPSPPREDTRTRLLRAGGEVLEAGGYAAASVAAIAERAGVATGTLYRHFPSKAELFVELFRAIGDAELAAMQEAALTTRTAAEELDAVIGTFAGRAMSRPRLAWALVYEPIDPLVDAERVRYRRAYAQRMASFLRDRVDAGDLPDQDPDTTAAALIGGIVEALISPLSPVAGGNADPDAVIVALTAFCRRAVGADAAPAARAAGA